MTTFGWPTRLKYGLLAALAGWLAAWAVCFPFELALAWRYVDGNARQLPSTLAKGLVVWGGFSFFMAMAGFVPLMLPLLLLVSPAWIVRSAASSSPRPRWSPCWPSTTAWGSCTPITTAIRWRSRTFFFTAPNFFVITFALVAVWVYMALAKRRLSSHGDGVLKVDLAADDTSDQLPCPGFVLVPAIRHAPAGAVA